MSGTRNDPAWAYCQPIPNNKNGTICTFCGHIMQSGGITRFKFHLSGKEVYKNVKVCSNVPPEVKKQISQLQKYKETKKKKSCK